jgi:hypothetical protein
VMRYEERAPGAARQHFIALRPFISEYESSTARVTAIGVRVGMLVCGDGCQVDVAAARALWLGHCVGHAALSQEDFARLTR